MKLKSLLGAAAITVAALVMYEPATASEQEVVASWYGEKYRGRPCASGEIFSPDLLTAAHKTLPFGTKVQCTLGSRSVIVRINDRGPFVKGREIDLSKSAFAKLAHTDAGLIKIKIKVIK